jgi:hypothetical protein
MRRVFIEEDSMSAKEAVTHIVSVLPEGFGFEEIVEALSRIYQDRRDMEDDAASYDLEHKAA